MIEKAIKERMKKEIKEIKKLYQATIDGGEPSVFHLKCDNVPNTLTLIKSEGNRRFGGFTSLTWESPKSYKYKDDKNAFLFSLDKKKIYPYNNDKRAIYCVDHKGPCFGYGHDIGIEGNIINQKNLYTYVLYEDKRSFNYNKDPLPLSEEGSTRKFKALEYEVFNVIFFN